MLGESAENYLEAIFVLQKRLGEVHSVDIANHLNFSKPSVSVAMKNLRDKGHISTDEHGHITLLESGKAIAVRIHQRHTQITDWLVSLGVDEQTASEDACRMEHIISDASYEAILSHVINKQ